MCWNTEWNSYDVKPGETPSNIYNTIMGKLSDEFLENFMGYGQRRVKFLGHGMGLLVDELPVIAKGFDQPIRKVWFLLWNQKRNRRYRNGWYWEHVFSYF